MCKVPALYASGILRTPDFMKEAEVFRLLTMLKTNCFFEYYVKKWGI
ncbi:Uncharacterized protein dnm_069480 [Desulfonema magnum]|uniref:Uncharacterized protein n=1 Tax=Desulfonema magnum TaxID=45655 RepID=A0A975BSJ3_9BACT|nr:Uncharacterized protein dnm_069480 [Desulfonema magnum]